MTLALQFEFLVVPQLADPAQPERGEWPPAPDRVFQALVATAAEIGADMSMLAHLEIAPSISASEAWITDAPKRYVPENFRRNNGYHQGAARFLPTVLVEHPAVTYIWHHVPDDAIRSIVEIALHVTHLGRASSLVRVSHVDPLGPELTWVPDPNGAVQMRSPNPGRLQALQRAFDAGFRSPPSPTTGYRRANILYPSSRWCDLMVLRPSRQLDGLKAVRWVEALRGAMMASIAEDIPPLVSGHGSERRIAWAAIPDIGHKHARGGLLGLGCWLPAGITDAEVGLLWEHITKIKHVNGVELAHDQQGLKGLQFGNWASASCQWGTVTPIALDRWPKKQYPAEQIIADSLQRMGLPAPVTIECGPLSAFIGSPPANRYHSRKQDRQLTHAVIRWHKPVAGPLLIGADRYFGGGLCRPITPDRSAS